MSKLTYCQWKEMMVDVMDGIQALMRITERGKEAEMNVPHHAAVVEYYVTHYI